MRMEGILADSLDMTAYIFRADNENRSATILNRYAKLEKFLLSRLVERFHLRIDICRFLVGYFYETAKSEQAKAKTKADPDTGADTIDAASGENSDGEKRVTVQFSLVGVLRLYQKQPRFAFGGEVTLSDMEDALLYLSKIGAMKPEGGFLVLYNGMEIQRLIRDNNIRYKADDYRALDEHYKQKIQQIHIVGEYAKLMVGDYDAALQFVRDYFGMDYKRFTAKYFKGERVKEIERGITPERYHRLFDELSDAQARVITDKDSRRIVVAAGPGSGKTRLLVHKLASLLLLEDVKSEQLLMLTFSRVAATEFKRRLVDLIGNAAGFVEIKTFHSYCFDLLGKIGSLDGAENVVRDAAHMIADGKVEQKKITKSVLVVDEAQDMDENEYALLCALMQNNEDLRVIAVGDDDQNIYEFRGSSSVYMRRLTEEYGATRYELVDNYRSRANIVALANRFVKTISERMKEKEIHAVDESLGTVRIVRHTSESIEGPTARDAAENFRGGRGCVLTGTNEEALRVLGLLGREGVRAKLIQSLDGFSLCHLAEVRFFLRTIDRRRETSVISPDLWNFAKEQLSRVYARSACLDNIKNLIADFEAVNPETKYRGDLEEFIGESKYEDFYSDERGTVFVSTVHKAKGREFDSVWLLLSHRSVQSDADRRLLYVAMTRAKQNLSIHCNNGIFDSYRGEGICYETDETDYPAPQEISLSLTHRDVVLDYFKGKKEALLRLRSGAPLLFSEDGYLLAAEEGEKPWRAAKLSRACMEKLATLAAKGYGVTGASIRFLVAWRGAEDTEETAVLLPDLVLRKRKNEAGGDNGETA